MFNKFFGQQSPGEPRAPQATVDVRLARLENKMDLLLRDLSLSGGDTAAGEIALPPTVRALAAQGRKIEAIKAYRDLTGASLKEAKEAVEGNLSPAFDTIGSLERKMDLVLAHLGIANVPTSIALSGSDIDKLIADGLLIQAIVVYRKQTGCDLQTAKKHIDREAAKLKQGGEKR